MLFIGIPIIALLIGALLSFSLPEKFDAKLLLSSSGWVGESLLIAAPVILITGAGGVFGKMLQNSGIADLVSANINAASWGIFLPFLIAMALITTASIVAPLLTDYLGLDSEAMRVFAVLSIGAIAVSHANDSFFWTMTQLTGMNSKQGNETQRLGTLVLSVIMIIYVLMGGEGYSQVED